MPTMIPANPGFEVVSTTRGGKLVSLPVVQWRIADHGGEVDAVTPVKVYRREEYLAMLYPDGRYFMPGSGTFAATRDEMEAAVTILLPIDR